MTYKDIRHLVKIFALYFCFSKTTKFVELCFLKKKKLKIEKLKFKNISKNTYSQGCYKIGCIFISFDSIKIRNLNN